MSYVDHIVERFGGVRAMARALSTGTRPFPHTTVQSWKDSGFIPAQRQFEVLVAGRQLDPPLTAEEFFGLEPKKCDCRKEDAH